MSIRLKLLAVFLLLAVASLSFGLLATFQAAAAVAEARVAEELRGSVDRVRERIGHTQERYRLAVGELTNYLRWLGAFSKANNQDADLGLASEEEQEAALLHARDVMASATLELLKGDRNEAIVLVNADHKVIYTWADEQLEATPELRLRVVQEALAGRDAVDLWSPAQLKTLPISFLASGLEEGDLLFVMGYPMFAPDGSVQAALLTAQRARGLLAFGGTRGAGEGPGVEVVLRASDGAVAGHMAGVAEALSRSGWRPGQVPVGARSYLAQSRPLEVAGGQVLGELWVLEDADREVARMLAAFRDAVLGPAVGVLLAAALAAAFMARRMARPLVLLEAAARRVRLGDLDVEVVRSSDDEVGRLATAFNEMVAGLRQRDHIKGLFKRYLSPQVVEELLRHPEKANPGGERRTLSVLFADLAGFTAMSEQLSPEDMVGLLNTYFEEATAVLTRQEATLDKFIGDAIMCFWNAPLPQEDHAARACLAALELLEVVDRLAPHFAAHGVERLDCRIGINTGACVAGNIGSREAQDFTVIGDAVNLASRLEGAAKSYRVRLLVSEDTLLAARGAVQARELDLLRVQGKQRPVRIFEVVGRAGAPLPPGVERFGEGLALYRAGRFAEAEALFASLPGDGPASVFRERCARFRAVPPPADWDGVHVLASK